MEILPIKDTKKFINLSKDTNKIHYDNEFATNFFFKKPILHGMNIVLSAFEVFLEKIDHTITINKIEINFKNFCLSNEKLYLSLKKNKIVVQGEFNEKIEIIYSISTNKKPDHNYKHLPLLKLYKLNKINNLELLNNCLFLSKFIGTKVPGNGSLIHRIIVKNSNIKNLSLSVKNIIKNIKEVEYIDSYKVYRVLCSKVKKFSKSKLSTSKINTITSRLNKKKILIFGIGSELGCFTSNMLQKYDCLISHHSFRLNLEYPRIDNNMKALVEKKICTFKPDYIFYFSTPEITNITKNFKLVKKLYESVYISYPKLIMDLILKKKLGSKIFLPSSIFLNDSKNYPLLKEYIQTKIKMEKFFKKKKYQSSVFIIRLPQFRTRSNYNMLGFYEGEPLTKFENSIKSFIN